MQVFHAIWLVDEHGDHPAPYTLVSAEDVEPGRWRVNPAVAARPRDRRRLRAAPPRPLHAAAGRGREVRPDRLALPRHARRHRPRARLGGRGGDLLPRRRPAQPARLPGQGRQPAHRALLDARTRGDRRARRRPRSAAGTPSWSRGCSRSTPSSSPARRRATAWRGPSTTCCRTRTSRSARRAHLPARGLHVPGRRARGRRLHGRGGTPPSSATRPPACTWSARPTRSSPGRTSRSTPLPPDRRAHRLEVLTRWG